MASSRPVLHTDLCNLLGIEYPILQSGMGGVAGPDLAAKVSNAGGLGIIAGLLLTADQLRGAIRQLREQTNRPFGVNLLLPPELRPPVAADTIPAATLAAVQAELNRMRCALGSAAGTARPATVADLVPDAFQVILDEQVPVFSVGLGNPGLEMVAECHRRGIKVIAMVTTVHDARAVEAAGIDAVVAQGAEAGGHRSHFEKPRSSDRADVGTVALIPEVVDAVRIPVIAAGGLADGRGLVAALALGASGLLMGSRFVATRESMAADVYKEAMVDRAGDATVVTDAFSGRYARALRNAYTEQYDQSGAPVLPFPLQMFANGDIRRDAAARGDADYQSLWCGQSVGLIHDLPDAASVVDNVVQEARRILLERLPKTVQLHADR
jgi:nitronate monooxygenase